MILARLTFAIALGAACPALAQSFEQTPGMTVVMDPGALPAPYATPSVANSSQAVAMPAVPRLRVPTGFNAILFAQGLSSARSIRIAANGDVFLAQSSAGRITVLRDTNGDGRSDVTSTFASGFDYPHGMAFAGGYLYVADQQGVWRLPYTSGATVAGGARERVTPAGAFGGTGGHITRNLAINRAETKLYVAIGSASNVSEEAAPRASIQEFNIDGSGQRTFASGLRNPVGVAFRPNSDELFTAVNERDGLGDELVPDYVTRVQDGAFYGWPYSYIGSNRQPGANWSNPQANTLIASAKAPDLLIRSHSAPLGMAFYGATQFPAAYHDGAFIALHGSWNAAQPRGYMVVYAPFAGGQPTGSYQVFASGFWSSNETTARVMGRPADVAVAADGSLLIADDGASAIWRVAYAGGSQTFNTVSVAQSFLRFYNAGSTAGTVTVILGNAATGENVGSWTSASIPAGASVQYSAAAFLNAITVAPNTLSALTVDVRASFDGFAQHVMWDPGTATIDNTTRCSGGPSGDGHTLVNVHSRQLAGYPSNIRIYNAGGASGRATLTLRDAATGANLAQWVSPSIPNFAALDVAISTVEAGASPVLTSTSAVHYVITLDAAFTGYLQHVVRNPTGALSEMTDKCQLTAQ